MLKSNIEGEPMGVSPKRDAFARTKEFLFEPFNQYRNLEIGRASCRERV